MGLLDGKVAVVTGAGGGIGRGEAMALAAEGAKIVVNDLGGDRAGGGSGSSLADGVVDEIKAAGGEAVANYESVASMEGGKKIVQTAIDSFGQIDILVNNAGILRDKTLVKMTEDEWDLVIAVHVKGTFAVSQPAFTWMKENGKGGRIINTSSFSGLTGNFGQSNYGTAKAGIAGFTRVVALEGKKYGITCNAVAPVAKTRMTDDLMMFKAIKNEMDPGLIAPIIVFLASEHAAKITGKIFNVQGKVLGQYVQKIATSATCKGDKWTVDEINERIKDIIKE